MTNSEQEFLNELPNEITIYRGMSVEEAESDNYRFSWSLSEEVAEMFAERNEEFYDQETEVVEITVSKKHILAYFEGREEQEVIYIPETWNH